MSNKWDYPTAAAATVTITFDVAGHLIEDSLKLRANQIIDHSVGGTPARKSFGSGKHFHPFSAYIYNSHASSADFADIAAFILTTINFSENSFQWTDENSVVRTVFLLDDEISFERAGQYLKFSVTLEEL